MPLIVYCRRQPTFHLTSSTLGLSPVMNRVKRPADRWGNTRIVRLTILQQLNEFFVFRTVIMNIVRNREIISFLSSQSAKY